MKNKKIRTFKFREGNQNDFDSIFEDYIWFAEFSTLNDPYAGMGKVEYANNSRE